MVKRCDRGTASRRGKTPEMRVVGVLSPYSWEKGYGQTAQKKAHCSDVLNYKLRLQKLAQREEPHHALVVLQKIVSNIGSTLWTDSERQRLARSVLRKPLIDESLSLVPAFQIHSQAAL